MTVTASPATSLAATGTAIGPLLLIAASALAAGTMSLGIVDSYRRQRRRESRSASPLKDT